MITTARSILDRSISEADFQRSITDLAETIHLPWGRLAFPEAQKEV